MPDASLVDVRVEDGDGQPVEGAKVRVKAFRGAGRAAFGTRTTNAAGRLAYPDAEFVGTELAGRVEIQVAPPSVERLPSDDPRVQRRELAVTDPRTEWFTPESV